MPSWPPANCSSGKSGCLVNTNSASVKNGPQALVREGNMHKQEVIKVRATSACQIFLGFIIINSRGFVCNQERRQFTSRTRQNSRLRGRALQVRGLSLIILSKLNGHSFLQVAGCFERDLCLRPHKCGL